MAGPGSRESLVDVTGLSPWTIGADYFREVRGLDNSAATRLPSHSYGAFVGYRPLDWLTICTTLGEAKTELRDTDEDSSNFRWSIGLQGNIWSYDLTDPEFLSGRWSIRTDLEYARTEVSGEHADGVWGELSAALLLNYEIFVKDIKSTEEMPYSLALYAGPILSMLDGSVTDTDTDININESKLVGVVAGADLYVSHNFSVGAGVQSFDHISWQGSVRYHF